jgi:hypothetical protein
VFPTRRVFGERAWTIGTISTRWQAAPRALIGLILVVITLGIDHAKAGAEMLRW